MIKIGCLVSDINHGLFYQRLRIPLQRLPREKYTVQFYSFKDQYSVRDEEIDVWVLCHPSESAHLDAAMNIKALGKPLIVDCDDLLDNLSTAHPEYDMVNHTRTTLPKTLELADHCVYSTEYLKRSYAHHNCKATVIENGYDSNIVKKGYTVMQKPYHTDFTIGWVGGKSHLEDIFFSFLPGLIRFMENNPTVRFHTKYLCPQILLDKFGYRVHFDPSFTDPWEYHRYLSTVPWDVCLVGLTDHPFNDAKSDLRFVDCAVHEIPIIASPRHDFIKHRDTGRMLYADDTECSQEFSWFRQLTWAMNNSEGLKNIGQNAKKYVRENRNDVALALKWERVIDKVCGEPSSDL